jgi:ATP-dependent DNA ligase
MVFDLLHWHRRDLTGRALRDRRARLEDVVAGSGLVFPANVDDGGPRGRWGAAKEVARLEEGPVAEADSRRGHS